MPAVKSPKRLLTDQEVAAQFHINLNTLRAYRWTRRGPPYYRVENGHIRYDQADVEKWMVGRTATNKPVGRIVPEEP